MREDGERVVVRVEVVEIVMHVVTIVKGRK